MGEVVEDVSKELPTPMSPARLPPEAPESGQSKLFATDGLNLTEKRIYRLLSAEGSRHTDDQVETSGLNSSEVLATLFALAMKGIIWQFPGKEFREVLLQKEKLHRREGQKHRKEAVAHQEAVRPLQDSTVIKGSEKDTHRPAAPSCARN